jgi:hypothetical protein
LVSVAISSTTIPNPILHTTEKLSRVEAENRYVSFIEFEHSEYLWDLASATLFFTPEYMAAWSYDYAEHNLLNEKERTEWLSNMLVGYEDWLSFRINLYSPPDIFSKMNAVSLESSDSVVTNIVLINDIGTKAYPKYVISGSVASLGAGEFVVFYACTNTVIFFNFSTGGEKIIRPDTKWIRLWLITPDYRAYFQYDFE